LHHQNATNPPRKRRNLPLTKHGYREKDHSLQPLLARFRARSWQKTTQQGQLQTRTRPPQQIDTPGHPKDSRSLKARKTRQTQPQNSQVLNSNHEKQARLLPTGPLKTHAKRALLFNFPKNLSKIACQVPNQAKQLKTNQIEIEV
jgi:hypothetical protein